MKKVDYDDSYSQTLDAIIKEDSSKQIDTRSILPPRRVVNGIIINDRNELLVQLHKKVRAFTLPGGKCNENEDFDDAIHRELNEELDINVVDFEKLKGIYFETGDPENYYNPREYVSMYYKILDYCGEIKNAEPKKHRYLFWVPIDIIPTLHMSAVLLSAYYSGLIK